MHPIRVFFLLSVSVSMTDFRFEKKKQKKHRFQWMKKKKTAETKQPPKSIENSASIASKLGKKKADEILGR